MKKILFYVLGVLMLASCAGGTQTERTPVLNESQSIYIMLPETSDVAQTYLIQQELKKNFQKFLKANIFVALDSSSIKAGFIEAKKQKANVMVCPMITQWTDSARDKIGINIRIFDVNTQKVIDEQNLYKKSKSFAFRDAAPDRLIPGIVQKYVTSLYK